MNKDFRVFIFFITLCLLPLKLPAAEPSPFEDPKITISMDFQDANLKDVVKIFSIQSGLNFIASEAVQDRMVTLFLDKVPVKEAMDKLFKANNLTYELDQEAKIFIVKDWGKPEIDTITKIFYLKHATVSSSSIKEEMSKQISSAGTTDGGTSTGSSGGSGKWSAEQDVGITKAVKKNLSGVGSVIEDYRTNSFIVTDVPSRMPAIEKLIASLDIPVPQVMLEVEILDVSKNVLDKLGFEFGEKPFTLLLPNAYKHGMRFLGNVAYRGADAISSTTAGAIVWGNVYGQALDFLRTQTDTKYLARPKLLTLNNETAEISITKDEVVGKKETSVTPTTGGATTTVEYTRSTDLKLTQEGTGIFLRVTPQINIDTSEITMVINPKSSVTSTSALSTTANPQSDVEVRSTKSIVKVRDGETVILGGLIHNDKSVTSKKLPILGDIPFIGALFRHKNQTRNIERELLVFITPHIIKDTNVELAQAKKTGLATKGQITISPYDRQSAIDASLNSFEKRK